MAHDEARRDEEALRQRFDKVVEERAKRLGVPPDAAREVPNDTPLFRQAAEALGRAAGVSADAVLDSYGRRVTDSAYPTAECLTVDDVMDYGASGTLSDAHQTHLGKCDACTALASATQPSNEGLSRFTEELREMLRHPTVATAPGPERAAVMTSAAPAPTRGWARRIWEPLSAFAGAFVAVLVSFAIIQGASRTDRLAGLAHPSVTADAASVGDIVKQLTELQRTIAEATQVAARAELAARDARSAQTALAANQAEALKRVSANLEEYKKVALGAAITSQIVWGDPARRYQKGDIIVTTGQGTGFSGGRVLMVENPVALNEVKGEMVRSMREMGLQPAK